MPQKLFIISGLDESKPLTQLKCVTINCDNNEDNKRLFLIDSNHSKLYECIKQTNNFRSFFVDNSVVSEGDLYVCTPFDVIYIILPFLMKKRKHFHSIFEILSDIFDKEIVAKFEKSLTNEEIGSVADIKYINEELFIRYNSDKAMVWLRAKTETTVDALINNNITVSSDGCKVSGYTSGKEDQNREKGEYTRIAFELISQYLNDEIKGELKNLLRLPQELNDSNVSMTGIKRKINESQSSAPLEDYSQYNCGPNISSVDQKRSKMSRSQKELLKVDRTGMKSISSFFKPKQK